MFLFSNNISAISGIYPQNIDLKIKQTLNFENINKPITIPQQIVFQDSPLECIPATLDVLVTAFFKGDIKSIEYAYNENSKMIDCIEKISKPAVTHLYLKSRLYLNKSMLQSIKKDYVSSIWNFYKTFNMVSEIVEKYPDFAPAHTFGRLFNQILKTIEDNDMKISVILPKPISINEKTSNINWSEYDKSLFTAIFNYIKFDTEDNVGVKYTTKTNIEAITYSIHQISLHNPEKILETVKSISHSSDIVSSYLSGWAYLTIGHYDMAKQLFEKQLQNKKTSIMKKSSLMGLFYIEIITQQSANREKYLKLLSELPDSYAYGDLRAEKEIKLEHHPLLLKARLLCDGKKYEEAFKTMNNIELKSLSENFKLEYYYRLGRIYYLQNMFEKSLMQYQTVFDNSLPSYSYYKAQAAFDCAQISFKKGDLKNAEKYVDKCIKLAKECKRSDIEQKAKRFKKVIREPVGS